MSRGGSARLCGGTSEESLLWHAGMRRQDLGSREMERMSENKRKGCFTTSCMTETSPCLIPSTQKCLEGMSSLCSNKFHFVTHGRKASARKAAFRWLTPEKWLTLWRSRGGQQRSAATRCSCSPDPDSALAKRRARQCRGQRCSTGKRSGSSRARTKGTPCCSKGRGSRRLSAPRAEICSLCTSCSVR